MKFPTLSSNFAETHYDSFWCQSQRNLQKEKQARALTPWGDCPQRLGWLVALHLNQKSLDVQWFQAGSEIWNPTVLEASIGFPILLKLSPTLISQAQNSWPRDGYQNLWKVSWKTMVDGIKTAHYKEKPTSKMAFLGEFERTFTDACEQDPFKVTLQYSFPALSLSPTFHRRRHCGGPICHGGAARQDSMGRLGAKSS